MATLTSALTLSSTDGITNETLGLSATDRLTITSPSAGLSTIAVTTVGANNIIQPATDGQTRYVYVKHTAKDSGGSTVTTTLNVELTGDVIFAKLAAGEWCFLPVGGHSLGVQLQASGGTIVAEYAYWTKG